MLKNSVFLLNKKVNLFPGLLHYSVAVFALLCLGCKQEPLPPNVLFIAVDDLRTELGAYGNSLVQSPNLDGLAAEGTLFKNHFVHVPTCGASRYALLTGLRPSEAIHLSNKAIEVALSNRPKDTIPETFIHKLKMEGYHTLGIGKISHSPDGYLYGYEEAVSKKRELPHSWSELVFNSGKWQTGWNAFFGYADGENRQSLKKQVKPYENADVNDQGYPDGLTTQLAIKKLREMKKRNKPFFMGVGFFKPHLPFNAPKKYWELYDRDAITVSPNPTIPENVHLASLHNSGEFNQYALGEEMAGLSMPISEAYARKVKHAYLAALSYIDAQIGIIQQELKALNLDKNTIIVVWGDHGWHLGDQQIWGKHTLFENALKSPLIIYSPYLKHKNRQVENIVETVDLYPTLLELCGLHSNTKLDGESLVALMEAQNYKGKDVAYSYFNNGVSLRTSKYRLTKYYREEEPTIELYDHNNDSLESKNIAEEKTEIVRELMPLLDEGDPGLYKRK